MKFPLPTLALACLVSFLITSVPAAGAEESHADAGLDLTEWGVLAHLPGSRWQGTEGGQIYVYVWSDPGQEMRVTKPPEPDFLIPRIVRGDAPGELLYRGGMGDNYTGRVAPDGSVVFRAKLRRPGFRLSLTSDGELLREQMHFREDRVLHTTRFRNLTAAHAEAVREAAGRVADPAVWGVYAQLIGAELTSDDGTYRAWRWAEGDEIVEDHGNQGAYRIAPDGEGGLVVIQRGNPSWRGAVAADGSVLWRMPTGGRVLNALTGLHGDDDRPYRVRADSEGMTIEHVRLRGGEVVSVTTSKQLRGTGLQAAVTSLAAAEARPVELSPDLESPPPSPTTTAAPPVTAFVATEPVSLPVVEPPSPFEALFRHAGKRLVGETNQIEIQRVDDDTLVVQFFAADGRAGGAYRIGRSPGDRNKLVLHQSPYGRNRLGAEARPGGAVFVESQHGWSRGWRHTHLIEPVSDGVVLTYNNHFKNQLRITLSDSSDVVDRRTVYRRLTEERAVEAMVAARLQAERDRIARENRRQQQAAHEARVAAAFRGFEQGVSGAMTQQAQAQQRQQAFLDETAIRAQAIAEYREQNQREEQEEAARQHARQQQAGNDVLARQLADGIAYRDAQAASATDPHVRQQWQAENERAMQEAQRLGLGAQVAQQVASNRQAASERGETRAAAQVAQAGEREREQPQAEARRMADERASAEQAAWHSALAQARSSLRLGATTCPGGGGRYFVTGPRANVQGCVSVSYEARCAGTPSGGGSHGRQHNYVGGSCLGVGDAIAIPGSPLSCPVSEVIVDVVDVGGC